MSDFLIWPIVVVVVVVVVLVFATGDLMVLTAASLLQRALCCWICLKRAPTTQKMNYFWTCSTCPPMRARIISTLQVNQMANMVRKLISSFRTNLGKLKADGSENRDRTVNLKE